MQLFYQKNVDLLSSKYYFKRKIHYPFTLIKLIE